MKTIILSTLAVCAAGLDWRSWFPRLFSHGPGHGVRPVAAPAPAPMPLKAKRQKQGEGCCFNDNGAYYGNLTILGACCGEAGLSFGYVASDPANQQSIMVVSKCHERTIEDSHIGAWARFCEEDNSWYQTAWHSDKSLCVSYKLPDHYAEPYTCFGDGTHFDTWRGSSSMAEGDSDLDRFVSVSKRAKGGVEVWVSQETCAPYFLMGGSFKYNVYVSAIHQNGTATVPEGAFGLPSYCDTAMGGPGLGRCPGPGRAVQLTEGLPKDVMEAAETARIFLGGRE